MKRYLEKQKQKLVGSWQKSATSQVDAALAKDIAKTQFNLSLQIAARAVASDQDFRRIPMWTPMDERWLSAELKQSAIGFYGNMANNHYLIVKALRRLGYQAELVLDDVQIDAFTLNRPFWEDISVACTSYEDGLQYAQSWQQPSYVHNVPYDPDFNRKYAGRLSAIPEIQALYLKDFAAPLPDDKALLLAQLAGYWPYLLSMKRYDIVQFCNAPTMLAPFCPRPYLLLPSGGELRFTAFEENWRGLLTRAGFRQCVSVMHWDSGFPIHLDRLGAIDQTHVRWLVDLDLYPLCPDREVLQEWAGKTGGERFILMPCRQSWQDKGNDVFLKGFAKIKDAFPTWRILLLRWGTDIEKTEQLVESLGLQNVVHWVPLLSKALLRRYQASADLIVDHCMDFGVGSAPIEGMAAGTPILIRLRGQYEVFPFPVETPPFLTFDKEDELPALLQHYLSSPDDLAKKAGDSRQWVAKHLSRDISFPYHEQGYLKALRIRKLMQQNAD